MFYGEDETMISIDEMQILLNELAEELPKVLYNKLNGGIIILPDSKLHPDHINQDLYVLGEYHNEHTMGRYIVIYYGSYMKLYGQLSKQELKTRLQKTLLHEFTHHIESLAGERGLEHKDLEELKEYKEKYKKQDEE